MDEETRYYSIYEHWVGLCEQSGELNLLRALNGVMITRGLGILLMTENQQLSRLEPLVTLNTVFGRVSQGQIGSEASRHVALHRAECVLILLQP